MDPATMMLLAAAASATSKMLGGIGANEDARLNAFNTLTDKKLSKVQAMQQAQARRQEYDFATSTNIAALAALSGRSLDDKSVQAFLKRSEDQFGKSVKRAQRQITFSGRQSDISAANIRRQGRNTMLSSTVSAATDVAKAYASSETIRQSQIKPIQHPRVKKVRN